MVNKTMREVEVSSLADWNQLAIPEKVAIAFEGGELITIDKIVDRLGLTRRQASSAMDYFKRAIDKNSSKYNLFYFCEAGTKKSVARVYNIYYLGCCGNKKRIVSENVIRKVSSVLNNVWC